MASKREELKRLKARLKRLKARLKRLQSQVKRLKRATKPKALSRAEGRRPSKPSKRRAAWAKLSMALKEAQRPKRQRRRKLRKGQKYLPPLIRPTRAKFQKRFKVKPVRKFPAAMEVARKMSDANWLAFTSAPGVRLVRSEGYGYLTDDSGRTWAGVKWYRNIRRDWERIYEAAHGRVSSELVRRWKLKVFRGFKVVEIDAANGMAYSRRRVFTSKRGVAIGQSDSPGYLGKVFEAIHPQNWTEGIWRILPDFMKRGEARGAWGLRITYRDSKGRTGVFESGRVGISDIGSYREWLRSMARALSELGKVLGFGQSGIAGRARVVAVDIVLGSEL
jgi:hypothetical protein